MGEVRVPLAQIKGPEKSHEDACSRPMAKEIPGRGQLTSPYSLFIALWNHAFYSNLVIVLGSRKDIKEFSASLIWALALLFSSKSLFLQEPVLAPSYSFRETHCPCTLLGPHTQVRHYMRNIK